MDLIDFMGISKNVLIFFFNENKFGWENDRFCFLQKEKN